VEQLIQLFRTFDGTSGTGRTSHGRLGTTLYAIATIGDERATEFLAEVARSHPDYAIRGDAVFYLGTIGSENARAALLRLLQNTP
jgi:HEAT repeat protein